MFVSYRNIPANLSNGGACDMVCCAVVGLMFAGLDARGQSSVVKRSDWKVELHLSFFSDGSYMMVLCSRLRRSNMRTLPSAPQLKKTSTLLAQNRTSKTSLSCAINCVLAVKVGMSHIVQVVSMLDVIIKLGDTLFQSKDVRGAVCSGDLEFERRARGVNF